MNSQKLKMLGDFEEILTLTNERVYELLQSPIAYVKEEKLLNWLFVADL